MVKQNIDQNLFKVVTHPLQLKGIVAMLGTFNDFFFFGCSNKLEQLANATMKQFSFFIQCFQSQMSKPVRHICVFN